ncbi:MAG: phosphate ABC transporter permease subunit PstC [Candidatus Aminicenantes bacterium]|nr:phosphate ABC transporter permease subunit PstC [Candidatus Aminicenantes bacterium]
MRFRLLQKSDGVGKKPQRTDGILAVLETDGPAPSRKRRLIKDLAARRFLFGLTLVPGLLVFVMLFGLFWKARAILAVKPLGRLLLGTTWKPSQGEFGMLAFLAGTLAVTVVAMVIAVPISLLTAVTLSEYAPRRMRHAARPMVDLLAGLPSVVYGVWGVLVIVPFVERLASMLGVSSSGYSILAGGIVLAIMVFPTIIHVSLEVFSSVSKDLRDAALSLGANRWEVAKKVVLRKSRQGIIAAVVLGLSRAFGETMAVLMVVGNIPRVPKSLFDPGYPLPALLANNYGEMMSVPLYDSALMLAALILMLVVLTFNVAARMILIRAERTAG